MDQPSAIKLFSKNLRYLRKKHSYTQQDIANKLSISYQAVSKWENEISLPDISFLNNLSIIFNCSIDDLVKKDLESVDKDENKENNHKTIENIKSTINENIEDAKSTPKIYCRLCGKPLAKDDILNLNTSNYHNICIDCIKKKKINEENRINLIRKRRKKSIIVPLIFTSIFHIPALICLFLGKFIEAANLFIEGAYLFAFLAIIILRNVSISNLIYEVAKIGFITNKNKIMKLDFKYLSILELLKPIFILISIIFSIVCIVILLCVIFLGTLILYPLSLARSIMLKQ